MTTKQQMMDFVLTVKGITALIGNQLYSRICRPFCTQLKEVVDIFFQLTRQTATRIWGTFCQLTRQIAARIWITSILQEICYSVLQEMCSNLCQVRSMVCICFGCFFILQVLLCFYLNIFIGGASYELAERDLPGSPHLESKTTKNTDFPHVAWNMGKDVANWLRFGTDSLECFEIFDDGSYLPVENDLDDSGLADLDEVDIHHDSSGEPTGKPTESDYYASYDAKGKDSTSGTDSRKDGHPSSGSGGSSGNTHAGDRNRTSSTSNERKHRYGSDSRENLVSPEWIRDPRITFNNIPYNDYAKRKLIVSMISPHSTRTAVVNHVCSVLWGMPSGRRDSSEYVDPPLSPENSKDHQGSRSLIDTNQEEERNRTEKFESMGISKRDYVSGNYEKSFYETNKSTLGDDDADAMYRYAQLLGERHGYTDSKHSKITQAEKKLSVYVSEDEEDDLEKVAQEEEQRLVESVSPRFAVHTGVGKMTDSHKRLRWKVKNPLYSKVSDSLHKVMPDLAHIVAMVDVYTNALLEDLKSGFASIGDLLDSMFGSYWRSFLQASSELSDTLQGIHRVHPDIVEREEEEDLERRLFRELSAMEKRERALAIETRETKEISMLESQDGVQELVLPTEMNNVQAHRKVKQFLEEGAKEYNDPSEEVQYIIYLQGASAGYATVEKGRQSVTSNGSSGSTSSKKGKHDKTPDRNSEHMDHSKDDIHGSTYEKNYLELLRLFEEIRQISNLILLDLCGPPVARGIGRLSDVAIIYDPDIVLSGLIKTRLPAVDHILVVNERMMLQTGNVFDDLHVMKNLGPQRVVSEHININEEILRFLGANRNDFKQYHYLTSEQLGKLMLENSMLQNVGDNLLINQMFWMSALDGMSTPPRVSTSSYGQVRELVDAPATSKEQSTPITPKEGSQEGKLDSKKISREEKDSTRRRTSEDRIWTANSGYISDPDSKYYGQSFFSYSHYEDGIFVWSQQDNDNSVVSYDPNQAWIECIMGADSQLLRNEGPTQAPIKSPESVGNAAASEISGHGPHNPVVGNGNVGASSAGSREKSGASPSKHPVGKPPSQPADALYPRQLQQKPPRPSPSKPVAVAAASSQARPFPQTRSRPQPAPKSAAENPRPKASASEVLNEMRELVRKQKGQKESIKGDLKSKEAEKKEEEALHKAGETPRKAFRGDLPPESTSMTEGTLMQRNAVKSYGSEPAFVVQDVNPGFVYGRTPEMLRYLHGMDFMTERCGHFLFSKSAGPSVLHAFHNKVLQYFTYHVIPHGLVWAQSTHLLSPSWFTSSVRSSDQSPTFLQFPFLYDLHTSPIAASLGSKPKKMMEKTESCKKYNTFPDHDIPGHDLALGTAKQGVDQCQKFCDRVVDCDVWVFQAEGSMCYLKTGARTVDHVPKKGLLLAKCDHDRWA